MGGILWYMYIHVHVHMYMYVYNVDESQISKGYKMLCPCWYEYTCRYTIYLYKHLDNHAPV